MKKFVATVLVALLLISMVPMSVFAASLDFDISDSGCDFYNVIEKNDYNLASGAVESEVILNDDTGANRNVLHLIEVDLKNPNISVMPTYMGLNENSNFEDSTQWGSQVLTEQAAHVENDLGLNVVGGMNTCLRYDNDHPYGVLVWNGKVYSDERKADGSSTAQTFLAVSEDGVASLHSASEPIPEGTYQAISANFGWIIKDGVSQYKSDDHADGGRAPRSVLAIKETGELILLMNDGRQAPYSAGATMRELAEWLLAMGCVDAVNCDGGGSSTFISEREGTGELTMKSSPSDGGQRATLGGILVISKAVADGKFDHAAIEADSESKYVTPGSTVTFNAIGADSAGGPAEIPADVTWQLVDETMGAVENGVFTSNGKVGTATVQMIYNGEVVGEDSIEVVIPEEIEFVQTNMTVPFGKTATLAMKATVNNGLNTVVVKESDFTFVLSDNKLGTIDGFEYTTCNEDVGISSGSVTATLVFDTTKTAKANINLGKGSEIVWDFEDGNINSLTFGTGYGNKHAAHKELGRFEFGHLQVVDSTTGQVKNGEKALAVICDYSDFYAMGYNMLKLTGLGVDMTDAVGVGFWIYLTPEATGLELDLNNAIPFDHGTAGGPGYEEEGWYYVYAEKSSGVGESFNNLYFYHTDGYDSATANNIPNIKTKFTVYIDDITVDYSTVVEDRDAPIFKNVSIVKNSDTYESMNGQTVTNGNVTVMAEAIENTTLNNYTGLDTSSAKLYVDGVLITKGVSCANNGYISADVSLSDGIHTFRFEIADNAGNYRAITRQLVVDATDDAPAVSFVPADATLDKLPIGSVYYMNLEVNDISTINKVSTHINLDGSSVWQLDYMDVATGFDAEYTVDDKHNNATITFTRNGDLVDSDETVLASLPIRTWEYTNHIDYPDCVNDGKGVCNFLSTPSQMWKGDGQFRIALCMAVLRGEVEFVNGDTDTFSSEEYIVDTEMDKHRNLVTQVEKNAKESWHIHTPVAVADKAATCTESGYTGRTVCVGCACGNTADAPCDSFDGCGSVVNWGTIIPATGHTFKVADGKIACDCGEVSNVNGLVEIDGNIYYAIAGNLGTGWIVEAGNYYYFDKTTFAALKDGRFNIDGIEYSFDENGVHTEGQWVYVMYNGERSAKYYFAGKYVANHFQTIGGKEYWFNKDGILLKGIQLLRPFEGAGISNLFIYDIDEDGVVNGPLDYTGVYNLDGTLYYVIDGKVTAGGVVDIDGDLYYVEWNGVVMTGKVYVVAERTNGLVNTGWNYFGEDGKLIDNDFYTIDGKVYYIVNGQPAKGLGVIEKNDNLYFVNGTGVVETGKIYIPADMTNGLVNAGYIYTDETGRIYNNEFVEIDGKVLYIVNGQPSKTGASLVKEIDGGLYFVEWNGNIPTGKIYISASEANGLTKAGWHYTDETGRLYDNEFATIDGKVYYMVKGLMENSGVSKVREVNGELYFIEWNGHVPTGKQYIGAEYVNGLTTAGWHYTDETGRLYDNEFATIDGKIYYMVHGQMDRTGVSKVREVNGELYFIEWNGLVTPGKQYIGAEYVNGFTTAGWHYADETGRLYNNEFTTIDGAVYYMVHGQMDRTGVSKVREINGGLYFVEWNGHVPTGKQYIGAEYVNGLTKAGWHYTDETGRLYDNEFATINGAIYYMVDGMFDNTGVSATREINGEYYFVEWNGHVATGKVYTEKGWRYTDETGAFYNNEIAEIDGSLYYVVDGAFYTGGVFEFEGDLYYAMWNGKLAANDRIYLMAKDTNGLIIAGYHTFDAEGKMVD
ncbi:MAG: phosphodiester glycosidase family protein [Ruminococcus sp.]|nr:phosphodiester glycosidase family protein [Ruminococcus sp.]